MYKNTPNKTDCVDLPNVCKDKRGQCGGGGEKLAKLTKKNSPWFAKILKKKKEPKGGGGG